MGDVADLIATLRAEGDDDVATEAKRAANGWPDITTTLSAFANIPGGGTLIFGLDEATGFAATGVYDARACRKALASACRTAVEPPITHRSWTEQIDGVEVVCAEIDEADASVKPVRVKATKRAYLRSHDGDFQLSRAEEQAFLANRTTPRFDVAPVSGASADDLDDQLVEAYADVCRSSSSSLARFGTDEILFRTGVLVGEGRQPSLAGLLALGVHPQQFVPNLVIQGHVAAGSDDSPAMRAADARRFDGPIPRMLSDALAWVRRNTGSRVVFGEDGHGRDEPEYPLEAVRELVANALVHRDFGEHALRQPITLRVEPGRLVVSNPGGLFGITRDRLGQDGVTSARNGTLIRICQHVRFQGDQRVCEALASGIPTVLRALARAQMTPPSFFDQAIHFTVIVPNHALLGGADLAWLASLGPQANGLTDVQRHGLVMLRSGRTFTNSTFRREFPMDSRDARRELAGLVDRGLAVADGERGGRTYRIADGVTAEASSAAAASSSRDHTGAIVSQLVGGEATVAEIAARTNLSLVQVKYTLRKLRDGGRAEIASGGRGRRTTYRLKAR
jgi:ATP-dependent DNA helicase RecG